MTEQVKTGEDLYPIDDIDVLSVSDKSGRFEKYLIRKCNSFDEYCQQIQEIMKRFTTIKENTDKKGSFP